MRLNHFLSGVVVTAALATFASVAVACGSPGTVTPVAHAGSILAPVVVELETDRADLSTPAAMCKSVLVADLTVGSLERPHWNTPEGLRPANLSPTDVSQRGARIYTPFSAQRMTVLVDHRSQPSREYVAFGGAVGADRVSDDEYPQLSPGKRFLVVFTPSIDASGQSHTDRSLLAFSAYPIDAQGRVMIQMARVEQGKVSQSDVVVNVVDIASQLARC